MATMVAEVGLRRGFAWGHPGGYGRKETLPSGLSVKLRMFGVRILAVFAKLYNCTMEVTIDTSVVLAVVCNEAGRGEAIKLTQGHTLIAPASLHWEMGNALSAMLKRQRITLPEAKACIAAYGKIPIRLIEVDIKRALALSSKLRMYAYDAYMLTCAQQSGSPLLTFDGALSLHASGLGIEVWGGAP